MKRFWLWFTGKDRPSLQERTLAAMDSLGGYGTALQVWYVLDPTLWKWSVSIGHLYACLSQLEEEGYVKSATMPGGPERGYRPRRTFGLTDKGRERAAATTMENQL